MNIKRSVAYLLLSSTVLCSIFHGAAQAQIAPASSDANTVVTRNGNTFDITGGTTTGTNLFHGFQTFGLNADQIANFRANPTIQNILGRVVGGDASIINGLIRVTGSNANLYLMNPAGIVFGANARLNVAGSFTATTANGIGFNDHWFNAIGSNDYANLIGAPDKLAFTMSQPGAIVNASFYSLEVKEGKTLTLVGGNVISTGQLQAPDGQVVVASVSGNNLVRLSSPGSPLSLEIQPPLPNSSLPANWTLPIVSLPQLLAGGTVTNATSITVNGDQVTLEGSGLQIVNGDLYVQNVNAQTATLSASNNLLLVAGTQSFDNVSVTTVGDLHLTAQNQVVVQDSASSYSGISTGGILTIQGNQSIDLQLLNNQRTHLVTGGNLNLISNGTITGNAHFYLGGNLSSRTVSGGDGNFVYTGGSSGTTGLQGIISANGDVDFGIAGTYTGNSLKIEARGSIRAGNITITNRNTALQGSDPDIGVLSDAASLILRAGVTELRNPPGTSIGQLNGLTFTSTPSPSPQGNITVGTIIISPPPTYEQNQSFGAVILSATGNIQVNGSIQARATDDNGGQGNTPGSAVILSAPQGSITVTGNVLGRSVNLSSKDNIAVGKVEAFPGFASAGTLVPSSSAAITSRAGDVTVQTIWAPFSQIDVSAFGLFQAKGIFLSSFSSGGLRDVPVSLQAQSRIHIQHGGEAFIDGLGVEKDIAGNPIFRAVPGNQRAFLAPEIPVPLFVYENGVPVPSDRIVTVLPVPFDSTLVPAETSFTAGLLVLKGGVDAVLRGVFQDRVLAPSSDIGITSVPRLRPSIPPVPIIIEPELPLIDRLAALRQQFQGEDGQVTQRQLAAQVKDSACGTSTIAAVPSGNRGGETSKGIDRATTGTATSAQAGCNQASDDSQILNLLEDAPGSNQNKQLELDSLPQRAEADHHSASTR